MTTTMATTMTTAHRNRRQRAMFNRVYHHRCGNMLPDTITWSDFIVYDEVKDTYSIKLTGRSELTSDGEILCGTLSVNLPEVPLRRQRPEELDRRTRLAVSQAANATHVDVSGTAIVRTPPGEDREIRVTGTVTLNMDVATTIQYITMDSNDMLTWQLHIELWGDTPKYLELMDIFKGYGIPRPIMRMWIQMHGMFGVGMYEEERGEKILGDGWRDPRIQKTVRAIREAPGYWRLVRYKFKQKSICNFWLKETCVNGMAPGGVLQKRDRAEFERDML